MFANIIHPDDYSANGELFLVWSCLRAMTGKLRPWNCFQRCNIFSFRHFLGFSSNSCARWGYFAFNFTHYANPWCSKFWPIMLEVNFDYAQIILYCLYKNGQLAFVLQFLAISAGVRAFSHSNTKIVGHWQVELQHVPASVKIVFAMSLVSFTLVWIPYFVNFLYRKYFK